VTESAPLPDDASVLTLLREGELTVEGRVVTASNLTLYARVDGPDGASVPCVYKPVSGERPLWDFPDGTLAAREVAAYRVSIGGGWNLVPPTVLRDGPLGPGMCQLWVVVDDSQAMVDVFACDTGGEAPSGWRGVLRGRDDAGRCVMLAHRESPTLRHMALLDAVLNNADRKGGHVLTVRGGGVLGVDHGLCFHVEPKLRTVLWGWQDEPLRDDERDRLECVAGLLEDSLGEQLAGLLSGEEVDQVRARIEGLLQAGRLPRPSRSWPAIPWPAF